MAINSIKTTNANSASLATSDQDSSESYWAVIALTTPINMAKLSFRRDLYEIK